MFSEENAISIPFQTFEHNLEHSLHYASQKSSESKYVGNFLYRIFKYVKRLKQENPNITKSEVEEIFANDLKDISEASYSGVKISQSFMNYLCYDLFSKQPERLNYYLSSLNDIGYNFDDLKELPRSTFALTQLYYVAKLKDEFDSSDFDDINKFLDYRLNELTPNVKSNISESILLILKQLDKLGLLDSYLDINTKKMNYLKFPEYAAALIDENSEKKSEKLLSIFSDSELMSKQSPFDLLTLYSFWVNRYYKELDTYLESMFIVRDFDLIPSMLDNQFKSPPKDELKKELVKLNLFYDPARFILEMQKSEKLKNRNESEYDISENIYSFSDDTFLYYIQNEYGEKYKNFFDKYLLNSDNDLLADAKHYFNLYNPIFATYGLKDATMLYLLIGLKEKAYYLNAGVIPSSHSANLGKFVGIGINNGMNDTFLLHIRRSTLIDFLDNYMLDDFNLDPARTGCSLPVFHGKTDFTNGLYSIPILVPMVDELKDIIDNADSNASNSVKRNLSYLKHLQDVKDYNSKSFYSQVINLKTGDITSLRPTPDFTDR